MEIKNEDYHIISDLSTGSVTFHGTLRLHGTDEYAPIVQLLDEVIAAEPETITLYLQDLRLLNSSGINMLFKFVIKTRERGSSQVLVCGATDVPWQSKTLLHLQRLMPTLRLEFERRNKKGEKSKHES